MQIWGNSPPESEAGSSQAHTSYFHTLDEGISQRDLCDRFRISPANVGARAKRKNLNTVAFLEQETGWRYVGKLVYSGLEEDPLSNQIENSSFVEKDS